jgi:hypothetical protein
MAPLLSLLAWQWVLPCVAVASGVLVRVAGAAILMAVIDAGVARRCLACSCSSCHCRRCRNSMICSSGCPNKLPGVWVI